MSPCWSGGIVIGRFIGLVRAVAPFLAGASGMRYTRFLPFSVVETAAWAATYVLLGFFFSRSLDEVAKGAGLATGTLGLVLALAVAAALVARRRGRSLAVSIPRLCCRARDGGPSPVAGRSGL